MIFRLATRSVLALCALLMSSAAQAATFEPKMEGICEFDGKRTVVSRSDLLGALLASQGLGFDKIRVNSRNDYERLSGAILDPWTYCTAEKCKDGVDASLREASLELTSFLERHSKPVALGQKSVEIRPSSGVGVVSAETFLRGDPASFTTACVGLDLTQKPPAPPKKRLMVRRKVEELRYTAKADDFKKFERATVALNDDRRQASTGFSFEGVAGYVLRSDADIEAGDWQPVPYVSYFRQYVDGKNPKKTSNVDNVALGMFVERLFGDDRHLVQFYPQLLHSRQSESVLMSANAIYAPQPLIRCIQAVCRAGDVYMHLQPAVRMIYGRVLDHGDNPMLEDSRNFIRVGPKASLSFYGATPALAGFSLKFGYEYLKVFDGPLYAIRRFEGALGYSFPEAANWGIELKYTDGRETTTLEQQRVLTFGVGFKF